MLEQFRADFPSGSSRALEFLTEKTFPNSRLEAWRFTNPKPLFEIGFKSVEKDIEEGQEDAHLLFRNGAVSIGDLPEGVHAEIVKGASDTYRDAVHAVVEAAREEVVVLRVAEGVQLDSPLEIRHVVAGSGAAYGRMRVEVGAGAQVQIWEEVRSLDSAAHNWLFQQVFDVAERARVDHVRVQNLNASAVAWAGQAQTVGALADFRSLRLPLGGRWCRDDLRTFIVGKEANAQIDGLLLGTEDRLVDIHSAMHHQAENCTSFQDYKGILADQSKGVFSGRIYVDPVAQLTDAKQSNNNILLSDDAQIDTNPELEIYADDVKCTHGATIGQLDEEALFYLQSRGIRKADAKAMLVRGFAFELIEQLPTSLRDRAVEKVTPVLDQL